MTDPNEIDRNRVTRRTALNGLGAGDQFNAYITFVDDSETGRERPEFISDDHVNASTGALKYQGVSG